MAGADGGPTDGMDGGIGLAGGCGGHRGPGSCGPKCLCTDLTCTCSLLPDSNPMRQIWHRCLAPLRAGGAATTTTTTAGAYARPYRGGKRRLPLTPCQNTNHAFPLRVVSCSASHSQRPPSPLATARRSSTSKRALITSRASASVTCTSGRAARADSCCASWGRARTCTGASPGVLTTVVRSPCWCALRPSLACHAAQSLH